MFVPSLPRGWHASPGRSADDRDPVGVEDHARSGLVGPCKVVEVLTVLVFLRLQHLLILVQPNNKTLV